MAEINSFDLTNKNLVEIPIDDLSCSTHWLILSDNKITSIPDSISNLKQLTRIAANDNRISYVSPMLCEIQNLSWIDLTRNRLNSLPKELSKLKKVTGLGLSENEFETIPECIFEMINLRKFGFFSNRIKHIPPDIKLLRNLVKIDLSNNHLTYLPDEFCELTNLCWLNLSNNRLKKLPENLSSLIHLEELGLGINQLTELPDLGSLYKLRVLPVFKNRLKEINLSFKKMKSIEKLDFSDNEIETFPYHIVDIPTLRYLNLKSNKITKINNELLEGKVSYINMIDISENLLSFLPVKFFKTFSSITKIRIGDNPYVYHQNIIPNSLPSLLEVCYKKCLNMKYPVSPWLKNIFKTLKVCDSCNSFYVCSSFVLYGVSKLNDDGDFVIEKRVCSMKCFKDELK